MCIFHSNEKQKCFLFIYLFNFDRLLLFRVMTEMISAFKTTQKLKTACQENI